MASAYPELPPRCFTRPTGIVLRPFMVTSPRSYPPPAMAMGRMRAMGHWMLRSIADLIQPAGVTQVIAGGAIPHRLPLRGIRFVTISFTIGYTRQSQKGPILRLMVCLFCLPQRPPLRVDDTYDTTPPCMLCLVVALDVSMSFRLVQLLCCR